MTGGLGFDWYADREITGSGGLALRLRCADLRLNGNLTGNYHD